MLNCFSQKEAARTLGLKDASPLSRWEKGNALPSILYLFRLSRMYKAMPSDLYYDLWKNISDEFSLKASDLLAPKEPIISNTSF